MSVCAIISEYNPFHNGHKFHIEKSKEITKCDTIIAFMSGNYVQRGAPAIIDKYTRTKICLENEMDIVFEIPIYYVLSSAQNYAYGCVKALHNLGFVDYLSFGSECGDIEILKDIAAILYNEPYEFKKILRNKLKNGENYSLAMYEALCEYSKEKSFETVMKSPNNILGIEYIKALLKLKSSIKPLTIKREGVEHDSNYFSQSFASASYIRNLIIDRQPFEKFVPYSEDYINKGYLYNNLLEYFANIFKYQSIINTNEYFENINLCSSDIARKIKNTSFCGVTFNDIIIQLKSKDLNYSRLSRMVLSSILNISSNDISDLELLTPYIKILGLKKDKSFILSDLKNNPNIITINKWSKALSESTPIDKYIKKELQCNDIYYSMCNQAGMVLNNNLEITKNVIIK